jgi:4-amino-4-deoxy-L-arabinose transferase
MRDLRGLEMKNAGIAIFVLFIVVYVLALGVAPLFIPDETRYAEIPREMIATGNWVSPHLNGLRYFEKPVMGYWLGVGSLKIFGENAFAARFPSTLSTGLAALLLFLLLRKVGIGQSRRILAVAIFLTCMEVFAVGVFSVLDAELSLFVTGTMAAFYMAYVENDARRKGIFLALAGISCGLAFLTKGFLGFALPACGIAPFLLWERRWKKLFTMPWIPLVAAVAVALPWCVMIHLREHDFWNYFFWTEHIKRFSASAGKAQHPEAWWYFVPVLILGAIPWTFLAPAAASGLRHDKTLPRSLVRYCICWFVFPFLLVSASHGKLGTYILPCFAPLAVLLSCGLVSYLDGAGGRKAFGAGALVSASFGAVLAIVLIVDWGGVLRGIFKIYEPYEMWKCIGGLAAGAAWCAFSLAAWRSNDSGTKLAMYAIAPLVFLFSAHFIIPESALNERAPGALLQSCADRVAPNTILVSDAGMTPAVCWFYKRSDVYLLESRGELDYGLRYPDSTNRFLKFEQLGALIQSTSRTEKVVAIADTETYSRWKQRLPKPEYEQAMNGTVFASF